MSTVPLIPAKSHLSPDVLVWTIAAVGVAVTFLLPPLGALVIWAAVVTAWVTPVSTRTRIIITTVVGIATLLVTLGFGTGSTSSGPVTQPGNIPQPIARP